MEVVVGGVVPPVISPPRPVCVGMVASPVNATISCSIVGLPVPIVGRPGWSSLLFSVPVIASHFGPVVGHSVPVVGCPPLVVPCQSSSFLVPVIGCPCPVVDCPQLATIVPFPLLVVPFPLLVVPLRLLSFPVPIIGWCRSLSHRLLAPSSVVCRPHLLLSFLVLSLVIVPIWMGRVVLRCMAVVELKTF
jgi:hypothetical protein